MPRQTSFGSYVDIEKGKRVVKELTYGNPTPQLDAQEFSMADDFRSGLLRH